MKKIGIVDFGFNNFHSIFAAVKYLKFNVIIIKDSKNVKECDSIILPGVGTYANAMNFLKKKKLDISLKEFAITGKPILGICLGMQLLFEKSEEFGVTKGLGILQGEIKSLKKKFTTEQLPNIGWYILKKNNVNKKHKLFNVSKIDYVYFVHSFFAVPREKNIITSNIKINNKLICASVQKNNIFATQFHPEKSGRNGLEILNTFCKIN